MMGALQGRKWILGVLILAVAFFVFAPLSVKKRALSVFDPHHPNNVERTYMWKAGLEMMRDYPLTGVGDMDLGELYAKYKPPEAKEQHGHLHNNFIMFGVTLGVPGLVVFLALFIRIFIRELQIYFSVPAREWLLKGVALGSLTAFVGFQVNGLFEWNFGDAEIAMLLWLTVGLALAVDRIHRQSRIQEDPGS